MIDDLGLTIHRNEYYPPGSDQDTEFDAQAPYFQKLQNKALEHNEPIKFIITYWTPPAFMKTNNSHKNGGHVKPEYYDDLGSYTVDMLNKFSEIGINIYAVSSDKLILLD